MNPQDDGIRKVAILVASLDRRAADRVLQQMEPRQVQRVRRMMVELERIDPAEQQCIIEEFFRAGPAGPAGPDKTPPGIELDGHLRKRLAPGPDQPPADAPAAPDAPDAPPFRFLHEAEGDKLARILAAERPQTIALVLSHPPPEQAGRVLVRLAPPLQVEVIRRLVDLEETEPEILREVEGALQARLSQQILSQRRRVAGLSAVTEILKASERRVGTQILDNLASHDRLLAEKLTPGRLEFGDLALLDDARLNAVLEAVDPELAMLALIGAPPELIGRILRKLPESEAKLLRHRLDHPGPIQLSDVDEARRQITQLAQRLTLFTTPPGARPAA